MNKLFLQFSVSLFMASILWFTVYAEPVEIQEAQMIVSGKIHSLDKSQQYSVCSNGLAYSDESGITLFYLFRLEPKGYMVITADDHLPPVLAYSFMDDFPEINSDKNPLLSLIRRDISLRLKNVDKLPSSVILDRKEEWNQLLQKTQTGKTDKFFQQWPPEGTTSTGGWLETNWTQSPPYNNFCPMDPVTNQRSVAGCPATAMAQIVNYYQTINATFFTNNDDYHHNYAGRNYWIDDDYIAIDFPSFPDLNAYLDTVTMSFEGGSVLKNSEKAALTFACGVAAHQVYTSQGSGTFGVDQAEDAYLRFGFAEALLLENTDTSLYTQLAQNIMEARPAHLAIVDPGWTMGHNVVADGYNTDEYFHLNFGWGGSYNGWYLLPDEIPYGLTVIEGLIVNIAWAPVNTGLNFNHSSDVGMVLQVYPNPVSNEINLRFSIRQTSRVSINIYNANGSVILSVGEEYLKPGDYNKHIDLRNNHTSLAEGLYLYRIQIDEKVLTQKFIVR
jgi:hypothetical protein